MPKNTKPNNIGTSFQNMERLRGEYEYPEGFDLDPDKETHRNLLKHILTDAKAAHEVIQDRFDVWSELDEKLTVYIDLDSEEESIRNDDERRPVSIVVPITYATRETLLTYWVAAFLQSPIFRYMASRDPKDILGVLLLENIIEQHCIRSKVALDLHTFWSDSFTYGFGAVSPTWRIEKGYRTTYDTEVQRILGFPTKKKAVKRREEITQFEGNALSSLDPYNCLPDPSFPIVKVQDMNFFGWVERTTYNSLLMDEKLGESGLFNVKYLSNLADKTSSYYNAGSEDTGRYSKSGINFDNKPNLESGSQPTDVLHMYSWIIPKDFGLGDSEYPEIWKFAVAADRIIIEASELGLDHNKIPVATASPDSDGHTTLPVSILEREYPLQHAIDWLWQSHVANVRKSINNMLVVDPSLINMNDLVDTKYGMVARLRAAAWGRGVNDAVEQLQVQDVTQGHISDIGFLMNIDNLVFTSNQAKGAQERRGERVSAQEARDTRMSFLSKMEKGAKIGAIQGHYDIAYQFASNTIQMIEEEQYIRITGDYDKQLQEEYQIEAGFLKVKPEALDVRYDVIPQDGTIPGGEYADIWERLMTNASAHPETFQQLDFTRVWLHIARLLGAKNPQAFLKKNVNTQVRPQEEIDNQVQQGNLVPVNQLGG